MSSTAETTQLVEEFTPSPLFSLLDHEDLLLGNIFKFFTVPQVIKYIVPICRRWKEMALLLKFKNFSKQFFGELFDEFCQSLTCRFVTDLSLFKPDRDKIEKVCKGNFRGIRSLHLTNVENGAPQVCWDMLALIVNCPEKFADVTSLDLHRFRLEDAGLEIIANSQVFNHLTTFNGYWNGFTVKGIKIMESCSKFSKLTFLELTDLNAESFKIICESPTFQNLTKLDVGQGRITNEALGYYANSPYLTKVKTLVLDRCPFDSEGIRIMCSGKNAQSIESLAFEYTYIGDEGVKYLANSPNMINLQYLDITRTDSGDESAKYIAESPYLKRLIGVYYEHYYSEDPYYEGKYIDEKVGAKYFANIGEWYDE